MEKPEKAKKGSGLFLQGKAMQVRIRLVAKRDLTPFSSPFDDRESNLSHRREAAIDKEEPATTYAISPNTPQIG